MTFIKKVWAFLVYSSANADKISLTLKGVLASAVTVVLFAVGFFHFNIQVEQITNISTLIQVAFNASLTALSYAVAAVTAWAVVWGAIRKAINTEDGTNASLNATR